MTTTLNPSDKDAGCTLSNGNLSCTCTSTTQFSAARSTTSKSSGFLYFEVTLTTLGSPSNTFGIGIATSTETLINVAGNTAGPPDLGISYKTNGDFFFEDGAGHGPTGLGTPAAADVICVAIDMTNGNMWMRRNNGSWQGGTGSQDPATNTGGMTNASTGILKGDGALPINFLKGTNGNIFVHIATAFSAVATVNFGASAFAQTVPSGFTAWDPPVSLVNPNASLYRTFPVPDERQFPNAIQRKFPRT